MENDKKIGREKEHDEESVQLKVPRRTHRIIKIISAFRHIEMIQFIEELVDRHAASGEDEKAIIALISGKGKKKT